MPCSDHSGLGCRCIGAWPHRLHSIRINDSSPKHSLASCTCTCIAKQTKPAHLISPPILTALQLQQRRRKGHQASENHSQNTLTHPACPQIDPPDFHKLKVKKKPWHTEPEAPDSGGHVSASPVANPTSFSHAFESLPLAPAAKCHLPHIQATHLLYQSPRLDILETSNTSNTSTCRAFPAHQLSVE